MQRNRVLEAPAVKVAAALESLGPHEAVEGFRRTEEGFMNGFSAFASQPPTKGG